MSDVELKEPKAEGAGETKPERGFFEEIEVKGEELIARVKALAAEGQVRRIRVREPDGDLALDIPLTFGAVAGGAMVLAAPALALLGTLAALVARVKVEIVRDPGDKAPGA
jgi:hypothetical protein